MKIYQPSQTNMIQYTRKCRYELVDKPKNQPSKIFM